MVPEVISDLTQPTVLVQKREEGFSLDKAETMMPAQKQAMGRLLLQHYLHMLFRHGFVHADPQPANFSFRQYKKDYFQLIIYDFDGVMTNNKLYVDEMGNEMVQVNRADGLAVDEIKKLGEILVNEVEIPIGIDPLTATQSKFFKQVYQNPIRGVESFIVREN